MKTAKRILGDLGRRLLRLFEYFGDDKTIVIVAVTICFVVALFLRIMPMRWGIYLTEFDPYYEYYLSHLVASKGWAGIAWWFEWWFEPHHAKDTLFWYPYGRDLRRTSQPGSALTSATIYLILRSLNINADLYTIHAFVPAVFAAIAVPIMYLLTKKIHSKAAGILAALIVAISPAYLARTTLGGKHEGVAIPFMLLGLYLFIRAFEGNMLWAFISGLSMSMVVLAWGGYIYPWNLLALYVLVMIAIGQGQKVAKQYLVTNLIMTLFIAITPRFGWRVAFLSAYGLLPMVTNIASLALLVRSFLPEIRLSRRHVTALAIISLVAGVTAWQLGLLQGPAGRILSIIYPVARSAIIESVGEHRIPTWAMLYTDYQIFAIFFLAGIYVFVKRRQPTDILALIFAITTLYPAMSFARLSLVFTPALAMTASTGFCEIFEAAGQALSERELGKRRKTSPRIRKEPFIVALALISLITLPSITNQLPVLYGHQPALILSSGFSVSAYNYQYVDWLSALEWMHENLPKDAVIACWWDYGYWIAVNTNRSTLADNGTLNTTQIAQIARAFLSPEDKAVEIFRKYNVTHVVVFEPFRSLPLSYLGSSYYPDPRGYGDFGKSYWMARIAGLDPSKYQTTATIEYQGYRLRFLVPANTPEAGNATLYKLLFTKTDTRRSFIFEPLPPYLGGKIPGYRGPQIKIPQPQHFKLVYASQPNEWVLVFEVLYNETKR